MRCFFALDLPEPVQTALGEIARELAAVSRSVRAGRSEQMHVTLKFLGEIDERRARQMDAVLQGLEVPPMQLRIQSLGRFPSHGPPRVLWAGLDGDVAAMTSVARELEDAAERIGVPREDRPFHPHVTLGRVKWIDRARELGRRLEELSAQAASAPFAAPAVTLYRSELGGDGSRYSVLSRKAVSPE